VPTVIRAGKACVYAALFRFHLFRMLRFATAIRALSRKGLILIIRAWKPSNAGNQAAPISSINRQSE
jgi:hypothetical protein